MMQGRARALLLALIGSVVLGAVGSASASAALFHSEVGKTFGFGEQVTQAVYTVNGGSMKCKKVSGFGTMTGFTASVLPLTVQVSECTAFGLAAERNMNGCSYEAEAGAEFPKGTAYLVCPVGKEVSVTVPAGNCTISTPAQSGEIEFKNEGSGTTRSVLVLSKETNLKYIVHGPGSLCGTPGEYTNGKISGTALVKGYKDEARTTEVGIWVE